MSDTATSGVKQGFQLKSASVSMTALELYYFDDGEFEDVLRDKISQAPGFFKDIPLIISLEKYQGLDSELDFFKIIGTCRRNNIHVVGVRGGSDDQRRLARGAALALLPATASGTAPMKRSRLSRRKRKRRLAQPLLALPVSHLQPKSSPSRYAPANRSTRRKATWLFWRRYRPAPKFWRQATSMFTVRSGAGRWPASMGQNPHEFSANPLRRSLCPSRDTIKSPKIFRTMAGKALCKSSSGTTCWW